MKRQFSILVFILAFGCSDSEDINTFDSGYNYFPVDNSAERVYAVTDIFFDITGSDTSTYELREYIADSILHEGTTTYLLKREKRTDAQADWQPDSVWTFRKMNAYVVVTENNVPYVKLSFPVEVDRSWNGNAFNTLNALNYSYQSVDSSGSTLVTDSGDLIKVVISDIPANLVSQDQRYEVYARGIGLVEKNYIRLNFCTTNCDGVGQIESGRVFYQYLIENNEK